MSRDPGGEALGHVDKKRWNPETREWDHSPDKVATMFREGNDAALPMREQMTHEGALTRVNARKATLIRAKLLEALESRIESAIVRAEVREGEVLEDGRMCEEASERVLSMLKGDTLRLLTDSEDRGYGKPTQKQELTHALSRDVDPDMTPETAAEIYQRELAGPS